ncbi:fumarylacetoacetate hydrolase family protein [Bacillus sp. Marseille-P3661]|uniref:fumarylacetoacetate hydrolase family protein n=1 Tax=Bacillus sp. Marseille-P3661 TaxID=1936234 RepID=UPI000C8487B7|nr:fumarylacetoacetate hydrolase family protein [Bacillus sp. Marseille-P3661]
MENIKNIYCVGRNYALHAKELNNEIPSSPFLFSKPTHSLVLANGQDVYLPNNRGSVHFETELVIRISKGYEKGMAVDDIVDAMAIGIDFTLRDVQSELKKKGHPWLLAKGFPNSAALSKWIPFPGIEECRKTDFSLLINGERVQVGNISNMLFDFQTIIDFSALHFGLGEGDIIFTGTPEGVGQVCSNDKFSLLWGNQLLGEFKAVLS